MQIAFERGTDPFGLLRTTWPIGESWLVTVVVAGFEHHSYQGTQVKIGGVNLQMLVLGHNGEYFPGQRERGVILDIPFTSIQAIKIDYAKEE